MSSTHLPTLSIITLTPDMNMPHMFIYSVPQCLCPHLHRPPAVLSLKAVTFLSLWSNQELRSIPSSSSLRRTCQEFLLLLTILHTPSFAASVNSIPCAKSVTSWDSAIPYSSLKPIRWEEAGKATTTTEPNLSAVLGVSSIRRCRINLFRSDSTLRCAKVTLVVGSGMYATFVGSRSPQSTITRGAVVDKVFLCSLF